MRPKNIQNKTKRKDWIRNHELVLEAVKHLSGVRLSASAIGALIEQKFKTETIQKHLRSLEAEGQIERVGMASCGRSFIINYIGARDESLQSSQA